MEFFIGLLILYVFYITLFGGVKNRKQKERLYKQAKVNDIDHMTGKQFEEFLYVLFKNSGYSVKLTKTSGDFGADLLLEKNQRKIAVQAKRYKNKVSVKAVQEIVAAKAIYKADEIWLVTNNYFTNPAKQLAFSNHVILLERDKLADLIVQMNSNSNVIPFR